jgi:steroid delta-isomerase-like uncharacterized protein
MPNATPVARRVTMAANPQGTRGLVSEPGTASGLATHRKSVEDFNAHNAVGVSIAYTRDATVHDPLYPQPLHGREAIREEYAALFRSHPDVRLTVRSATAAKGLVCYEMLLTGTHTGPLDVAGGEIPPSQRRLELPMAAFVDVDEHGQYREVRRYYDVSTFLQQLGLEST